MRFVVCREALLAELSFQKLIPEYETTIPVLHDVLLEVADNRLRIRTTDLDTWGCSELEVSSSSDGGATVSFKDLRRILKRMPSGDIEIATKGPDLLIVSRGSQVKLNCRSADSFPDQGERDLEFAGRAPIAHLLTLIEQTSFCLAGEESRFSIKCAQLRPTDLGAMMIVTDGHRMAILESLTINDLETGLLIPRKILETLDRFRSAKRLDVSSGQELSFRTNEDWLSVSLGQGREIHSRHHGSRFPDCLTVYEDTNSASMGSVTLDRVSLLGAVRLLESVVNGLPSRGIQIKFREGSLEITGACVNRGKGKVEIKHGPHRAGSKSLGVCATYLAEALEHLADNEVTLRFNKDSDSSPILIESGRYKQILMGIRFS